ncbi:MAG: BamA/TamA family outer membrane protein [Bacteroidales bacterium]|nr:BamA/TamA family outer membrane protein [Bacteroidales bacterium]
MKKIFTLALIVSLATGLYAQDAKPKTGWNFGALPTITFDTDLGFQYGGLVNLFNYGTGDIFPNYYQSLYFEVSRFTKGSGINRFMFESDYLIPGIQYAVDLSYLTDEAYDFYGFNGYDAVFNKDWTVAGDEYLTRMFYRNQRQYFRFKNDFQGRLSGENLKWNAGFNIQKFTVGLVDIEKLNKGKDEDLLPTHDVQPGLYQLYNEWGIISDEEFDGGWVNTVKAGLTFDTRDNRANPMKGLWTEAGIEAAPGFLGSEASFGKFYFTHRQYFTIVPNDLSFAYRLGYQSTIFGEAPAYYQSQVIVSILRGATSEGLGGGKSLRGVLRNRVIGDGFVYGNAELRWKAVRFNFINQAFYIGVNGFTDFGMVTKKIDFTTPTITPNGHDWFTEDFFAQDAEKLHFTVGGGLRIVMNENFIIAIDLGKALNEQDGKMGFYMGLNYLF